MSLHTPLRRTAATVTNTTTTSLPRTTTTTKATTPTYICSQCRHATLLRRPQRPYTFTQLVTLSDGSTYTQRTTSPMPVYRSTRDTRNSLLWNPSSSKLMNVEEDEAGRLAAFRARFGRRFDANTPTEEELRKRENKASAAAATAAEAGEKMESKKDVDAAAVGAEEEAKNKAEQVQQQLWEDEEEEDNLLDLISSFGQEEDGGSGKKQ